MAVEEAEKREREKKSHLQRGREGGADADESHWAYYAEPLSHSRVGVIVRVESRSRSRSRISEGRVGSQSRQHTLAELRPAGDTLGLLTLAYMGAQCRCQCR